MSYAQNFTLCFVRKDCSVVSTKGNLQMSMEFDRSGEGSPEKDCW